MSRRRWNVAVSLIPTNRFAHSWKIKEAAAGGPVSLCGGGGSRAYFRADRPASQGGQRQRERARTGHHCGRSCGVGARALMRVVLDTNVLLSALISPHGAPDAICRAWRAATFQVVTSVVQLDELRRASRYPKLQAVLQRHRVGAMVNTLRRAIVLARLPADIEAADPNDAFLLAMAREGDADYLVTGDRRAGLLQRKNFGRTYRHTNRFLCRSPLRTI